jgi:hypothetical protein
VLYIESDGIEIIFVQASFREGIAHLLKKIILAGMDEIVGFLLLRHGENLLIALVPRGIVPLFPKRDLRLDRLTHVDEREKRRFLRLRRGFTSVKSFGSGYKLEVPQSSD